LPSVVFRLDVLDEAVLGEQRLPLGLAGDGLEVVDDLEHRGLLGAEIGRGDEVARHAVRQARGLADVEHHALVVLHEVHTRNLGQRAGLPGEPPEPFFAGFRPPRGRRVLGLVALEIGGLWDGVVGHGGW